MGGCDKQDKIKQLQNQILLKHAKQKRATRGDTNSKHMKLIYTNEKRKQHNWTQ
jgi:hypothetical protein